MPPSDNLPDGSLERVEVIMALVEAFDVETPDEEAKKLRTVQDEIDYIQKRRKGGRLN